MLPTFQRKDTKKLLTFQSHHWTYLGWDGSSLCSEPMALGHTDSILSRTEV